MAWNYHKERALRLLFEGKGAREVAAVVGVARKTVAAWFADAEFLERARRQFTRRIVELLPQTLRKLELLLAAESESTALAAIKTVMKVAELATAAAARQDEMAEKLARVIDEVLDEVLPLNVADIDAFKKEVERKDRDAAD